MTKPIAMAVAAVALVAGCTSSAHRTGADGTSGSSTATHARLVAKAALDPCPASVPGRAPHGMPDVTLPCLGNGPRVHVGGLRGVPTVVNIWGSWCGPCQEEATYLSQVYDEMKPRVRFLGVDTDDEADSALDFGTHVKPQIRYPSVVDDNKKVLVGLNVNSVVPTTVFVDASGRVVHKSAVQYRSVAQLREDIARYLGVR